MTSLCQCGCGQPAPIATMTNHFFGHVKGQPMRFVRGHSRSHGNHKHGMDGTPECAAYRNAKRRCTKPNEDWKDYGGRGIKFLFENLTVFLLDIGGLKPTPKHSLDRINNDGNYEPGNVRWATPTEQRQNQRCTNLVGVAQ